MPGVYKALTFYLIQEWHGLALLGEIASWQAIAQILGFFTAIGWSSLILVRVAKSSSAQERVETFNALLAQSLITLIFFCTFTLGAGWLTSQADHSIQISLWLAAWTLYQLPRHYLIAQKKYRHSLLLDLTLTATSISALFGLADSQISLTLASLMLISGLVCTGAIQFGHLKKAPGPNFEIKGLEYGFANLLSGGIALSITPLTMYFGGKDLAGILSLFTSISSISLLIPRALSLSQLPQIAKISNNQKELKLIAERMHLQITLSNLTTTIFCLIVAVIVSESQDQFSRLQIIAILSLATLQGSAATQALTYANILLARESSRKILKINLFGFSIFTAGLSITPIIPISYEIHYICALIAGVNIYRLHATKRQATKELENTP